jgi:phospholipid/cholesterol/gamma-HCH transport system substrate-binding protein
MADQVKNLMIGLFITAAALIVIFMLMFLHPHMGDEGRILHVLFTDVDKITPGTRVTYAGKPVGEVVDIKEVEYGRTGKKDSSGHLYVYDLTLRVDSKVKVFNTDQVASRTSGLLGEKNIEITPIAPAKDQKLVEIDGSVIYAQESGSVEQTLKDFKETANKIDAAFDAATDILNRMRDNKLVEKISHTLDNIESISKAINQPDELSDIVANVHQFTNSLNKTWPRVDKFVKDIDAAALSITKFVNQGHGLFTDIQAGKGTLGRFLSSDDIYLRTNSIMSKLETILDDINHYGLLFQSDKGWQRLRARRMNLLQKLSTPQEFRNYFNDEVNQISTSLSRVYMVLNDVENNPCCCDVMLDKEFTKVFAELMRRVTMLEEEIRMYNTQVVEAQVHTTELGSVPCFPTEWQQQIPCPCPCPCPFYTNELTENENF